MIILDGGTGRHLESLGAPFNQPEWSALALMQKPEFVLKAHNDFIEAGADIITTNSYAVVPFHIGAQRFQKIGPDLLQKSGKLALEAKKGASKNVRIAASVPPMFGSYLPERFNPDLAPKMLTVFKDNLLPYCDLVLAETMASLEEVKAFIDSFSDSKKPIWVSITLEDDKYKHRAPHLRSGEALENILEYIEDKKPEAILFNCSQPEVMEPAILLAKKLTTVRFIGVYANAFPPQQSGLDNANKEISRLRVNLTPIRYREFATNWMNAGATIIGGCCGIGPDHIKALYELKMHFKSQKRLL